MSEMGSWLPTPKGAVDYAGKVDKEAAARTKFFGSVAIWLVLIADACISGLMYFEGDMTAMGTLCASGLVFCVSLLVLFIILALIWSDVFGI